MLHRLLALALLVTAPLTFARTLDLTNAKDEKEATALTARFLEDIGLEVIDKSEEGFALYFGGYNIQVTPYCTRHNGYRFNAYVSFGGRKSNVGDAKLLGLINEINESFNFVAMSVDKDGDFCQRYSLLFDKKVEAKVIQQWLRFIEGQTDGINSEFGDKLKPFLSSSEK